MPIIVYIIICGAVGAAIFAAGVWVGTQLMLRETNKILKELKEKDNEN